MNTTKVAAVLARLASLQVAFYGLLELTYLPNRIFMSSHEFTPAVAASGRLSTGMMVFRIGLHVLFSAVLWFQAQPIAEWLVAGLSAD